MNRFRFPSPIYSALAAALGLGAPGCFSCFASGTRVRVPGGERDITALRAGDALLAFDPQRGVVIERVARTFRHHRRPIFRVVTDLGVARTTLEHPYFTERRGFVPAAALDIGTRVLGFDGDSSHAARVLSVSRTGEVADVWNLEVSGSHTYFADGVLVHNKSNDCATCEQVPFNCMGGDIDMDGVPWERDCSDYDPSIGECGPDERFNHRVCAYEYRPLYDVGVRDASVGDAGSLGDAGPTDASTTDSGTDGGS